MKIGRNDPCHCGSGKKYKKCCFAADEAAQVADLAASQAAADQAAADAAASGAAPPPREDPGMARPKPRSQPTAGRATRKNILPRRV